jgi:hypothetical protein
VLRAQVYTFPISKTELAAPVEWSFGYASMGMAGNAPPGTARIGDWEVTVAVDTERCEISCVYRRIREATRLLPPVTEIRLHTGSGSTPARFVIDPAGLRLPIVSRMPGAATELCMIPGRGLLVTQLPEQDERFQGGESLRCDSIVAVDTRVAAALPLRI